MVSQRSTQEVSLTPEQERVIPWIRDDGDRTHRLQYDLCAESLVLDLGGYKGQWASDIYSMYCCKIHIFEPVTQFAVEIKRRFARNPRIVVHDFGLSDRNTTTAISVTADSSSQFKTSEVIENINLIEAREFFSDNDFEFIDLMKINIEGGEYDLLEHLIASNLVNKIRNIQVQFHDFIPDAEVRMKKIQAALNQTHKVTYQYKFVWENWLLKE